MPPGFFSNKRNVKIIKEWSIPAALQFPDEYFDFVYIDGDHSYTAVLQDLKAWGPKVKAGGFLGGHDYSPSPEGTINRAITAFLKDLPGYSLVYTPPAALWVSAGADGHYDFLISKHTNQ